jgi:hypothetical protein
MAVGVDDLLPGEDPVGDYKVLDQGTSTTRLRETLGEIWPVPWRNDLANAYMNRGNAKQSAPGHGAPAAIADYDAAVAIMERLREC